MSVWVIVPVKPLKSGKSRLISVLSESQRARANELMLRHVLSEISKAKNIQGIMVISSDPFALSIAREYSCRTIRENRITSLNMALRKATRVIKSLSADAALIIPADLPMIKSHDIESMVSQINHPPQIIICPDRHQQGTNAMLLSPVDVIQFDFGLDSFYKHVEQAERKKVKISVFLSDSISLDLDNPADLEFLSNIDENIYTQIID